MNRANTGNRECRARPIRKAKRFPARFAAEILTPSAGWPMLSRPVRSRVSSRPPRPKGSRFAEKSREEDKERPGARARRYDARSGNPWARSALYPRYVSAGEEGVGRGRGPRGWKGARGTPWLGSRRGVVITSRSDRVPLLSRRHTPAEKQNGTSDRPTLPVPPQPSAPRLPRLRPSLDERPAIPSYEQLFYDEDEEQRVEPRIGEKSLREREKATRRTGTLAYSPFPIVPRRSRFDSRD